MAMSSPIRTCLACLIVLLSGCAVTPPSDVDNVCSIFTEKRDWYEDAKQSRDRWNVPVPLMMAIMHQESRFIATAKPPRRKIWGFIPGPRLSDAYGYSQAKNSTWAWYERSAGNYGADRDNFGDAIDFVGWYCHTTVQQVGVSAADTFQQYLAYHEGHGGFRRKTYRSKQWLIDVARKVDRRAKRYNQQLKGCAQRLDDQGWSWWPW